MVANIYYNQPLLAAIGRTFGISDSKASLVATATQVGYTLGILLLVPLGDMLERKRLILLMLLGACRLPAAWRQGPRASACWPGPACWWASARRCRSCCCPWPPTWPPRRPRRVAGRIMSGLLVGILLSRTASGYVGAHFGVARGVRRRGGAHAGAHGPAGLAACPRDHPTLCAAPTAALMRSLITLGARAAGRCGARRWWGQLYLPAFSVFWTTLVFYLGSPAYGYGSDVAGFFGLVGAAGALAALAGRQGLADRRGSSYAITAGLGAGHRGFVPAAGRGRRLPGRADDRHSAARRGRAVGPHLQPNAPSLRCAPRRAAASTRCT
ncbi:MAG: hypothetical protein WKG07_27720 [Hymenobacter sp.]